MKVLLEFKLKERLMWRWFEIAEDVADKAYFNNLVSSIHQQGE